MSAILIIPLQQFLKIQLQEIENDWITGIQSHEFFDQHNWIIQTIIVMTKLADYRTTLFFGLGLFLLTDSLIAFKGKILYCFGIYFMAILKLLYQSARPFWIMGEINVMPGACKFDFAMPSD